MSPFLIELLSMLFRQGIIYLAGVIGASALASDHMTEITRYSSSAAIFVTVALYAAWKKYRAKQVLVTALASPQPMSENDAKAMVKDPSEFTPSVSTPKSEIPDGR